MSLAEQADVNTTESGFDSDKQTGFFQDLIKSFGLMRFWLTYSWEDIRTTYRHTAFGVLWITVSFFALLVVKFLIFRPMNSADSEYFVQYLAIGIVVWYYIANVLGSSNTFVPFENWLKNDTIPAAGFAFIVLFRCLFNFSFNALSVVLVFLYIGIDWHVEVFSLIPAALLTLFTSYSLLIFLGVISLRYRDIAQLVTTITRFGFFLSPIFWTPAQMGKIFDYLYWNPVAHFIWIFRDPILYGRIPWESWLYCSIVAITSSILAVIFYTLFKRRLIYWY